MKSAKEIKKIQEDAIRSGIEHQLISMAKNRYTSYCCSSSDCPKWLQEELIKKGFKVEYNEEDYVGVIIKW